MKLPTSNPSTPSSSTKNKGQKTNKSTVYPIPRIKMDINKKAINDLRSEIDTLKVTIHKVNSQIEDTQR